MADGQSSAVWQIKYSKNIKLAYGLATEEANMRILSFCQKNQSTDHSRFIFYKTMTLTEGQDGENTYNATNLNYDDIKGSEAITDFGRAVSCMPTETDKPLFRKKYADILSQVSIEGNLIKTQVSSIKAKTLRKILTPLKEYTVDGSFIQYNEENTGTALTIPAGQVFGDVTKTFFENEEALLSMLTEAEFESSGDGGEIRLGILYGKKGTLALKKFDKVNNHDYITTSQMVGGLGKKLSIKKFDVAEMLPIKGFDNVFTGTDGYMILIFDQALGYDSNKELDTVAEVSNFKKAKLLNATIFDNSTIVDEKGVYIFKWNGIVGDRIVKTETVTP